MFFSLGRLFLFFVSLTFWGIEEDYEPLPKNKNPVGKAAQLAKSIQQISSLSLFDQHDHHLQPISSHPSRSRLMCGLWDKDKSDFVSGMITSRVEQLMGMTNGNHRLLLTPS